MAVPGEKMIVKIDVPGKILPGFIEFLNSRAFPEQYGEWQGLAQHELCWIPAYVELVSMKPKKEGNEYSLVLKVCESVIVDSTPAKLVEVPRKAILALFDALGVYPEKPGPAIPF